MQFTLNILTFYPSPMDPMVDNSLYLFVIVYDRHDISVQLVVWFGLQFHL